MASRRGVRWLLSVACQLSHTGSSTDGSSSYHGVRCLARRGIASMSGGTIAQVAVGRYLLQIGDPCGAVIREAVRAERSHFRSRSTPVLLQPRLIRGLVDRQMDVAAALSALD